MATDSSIKDKVASFFSAFPQRTYDKGELLVRAEEPLDTVFYIIEGRVSQYDISPVGNEVVVNVFMPLTFFPMSTAMNHVPNHYFFEASTKTIAHVVPAEAAVQFLKDNPDVTFDLLARVYRGVDGVLRRMAHLMGGDASSRLLFELINAALRFGETQPDGAIFVPLKEHDLARQSGLARETVNRVLQHLKTEGVVTISRNGATVHNMDKLQEMLGQEL